MKRIMIIVIILTATCSAALFGWGVQTSAQEPQPPIINTITTAQADDALMTLRINGEDIPIKTILAYSRGGQSLNFSLSTHPLSCDDLKSGMRRLGSGEKTLSFTVAPALQDDGTSSWQMMTFYYDSMNKINLGPVKPLSVEAGKEVRVAVDVQIDEEASEFLQRGPLSLTLRGEVVAQHCGELQRNEGVAPRPQPRLKVTIGAEEIAIRGATISDEFSRPALRLSTSPHGCKTSMVGSDFAFQLGMEGDPLNVTRLHVAGDRLASQMSMTIDPSDGYIRLSPDATGFFGTGDAHVDIDAQLKVFGLPVTMKGTVTAEKCLPAWPVE
jgi:hypothetical protein